MGQATVRGGFDTYANTNRPAREYGGSKYLRLKSDEINAYVYLKNPAPRGSTIVSATLRIRARGASSGSRTLTARRIGESWKARKLNWNNKPGVVGVDRTDTIGSVSDGDLIEFDVTTHVQTVVNGSPHYGWRITTDASAIHKIYGFDAGDNKPTLEVVWSDKPGAPTSLVPSAGAVSVSHPVLQFDYADVSGTDLVGVRVQVDTAANGSSPAFDSGEVSTEVPELDLAETAYVGLADGVSTQWRVQVQDAAGLWSDWSDWVTFSRDIKGTLTIDNPAAAPNDFVTEATPPILWTLAGETQTMFQVRITEGDDRTKILYDSGKVKSTVSAHTLPERYRGRRILIDDRARQVNVRAWDTKDREATPGDPVFTYAWRTFTMDDDLTVPAPTLTAIQDGDTPMVVLTFTRSTAPDSWTILRDGKVIESDIDPDDVFVSGTTYQWSDDGASPHRAHTYNVRAVVNGAASGKSNGATVTTTPKGIWVIDFDRDLSFVVKGRDVDSWRMTDQASTYLPIGAEAVVRITTGMTGVVGSVTGMMVRTGNRTIADLESHLLQIKAQPARTVQLVTANLSIPVKLGNLSMTPHSESLPVDTRVRVSFDFWQDGDLAFEALI